jgi:hypothetical protein
VTERIRAVEAAVEDAADTLEDRANVVRVIRELSEALEDPGPWTAGEIEVGVHQWIARGTAPSTDYRALAVPIYTRSRTLIECADVLGAGEFARLLLAKGKELDLLVEKDVWDDDRLEVVYMLKKPSD